MHQDRILVIFPVANVTAKDKAIVALETNLVALEAKEWMRLAKMGSKSEALCRGKGVRADFLPTSPGLAGKVIRKLHSTLTPFQRAE